MDRRTPFLYSTIIGVAIVFAGAILESIPVALVGGIIATVSVVRYEKVATETRPARQEKRAAERGVCDSCGKSLAGSYIGCSACDRVFCSEDCYQSHYLLHHQYAD